MNKDITLEEYTNKFNRIFAEKEENGFSQEVLRPLWQSLQNDDMDITFDDEIYITEYGIKIVMNEDKIIKEGKYTLEEIYANIDDLADFSGMKKIDKNYYVSKNDTPSDLGCFAYTNLKRKSWFMENVKEWLWLDKKEGIDDILEVIRDFKVRNEI